MLSDLDNASVGEATSLSALFSARAMSDQVGFTFVDHQGATQSVSFAAMFQRALALSQHLQTSDVSSRRSSAVSIALLRRGHHKFLGLYYRSTCPSGAQSGT